MQIIHILSRGRALCGFQSTKYPGQWPHPHKWVALNDPLPPDQGCPKCKELAVSGDLPDGSGHAPLAQCDCPLCMSRRRISVLEMELTMERDRANCLDAALEARDVELAEANARASQWEQRSLADAARCSDTETELKRVCVLWHEAENRLSDEMVARGVAQEELERVQVALRGYEDSDVAGQGGGDE